jgi:hypothetical protein
LNSQERIQGVINLHKSKKGQLAQVKAKVLDEQDMGNNFHKTQT